MTWRVCRHANCVRRLSIADNLCRNAALMPTAATATMLGSQCSSLLELRIAAADIGLAGTEIASLAVLTQLTLLEVRALPASLCPL